MIRLLSLFALAGCLSATPPTTSPGTSPGASADTGGPTAVHTGGGASHSAYVVPDLPPPTPGPLAYDYHYSPAPLGSYDLAMVVAGPGEWDRFVAEEATAGCPHFRDDGPCPPLPDASMVGMTDAYSWLAVTSGRWATAAWDVERVEVTADGWIEFRFAFCGNNDDLAMSGKFFTVPRAAYAGVHRIEELAKDECDR